MRRNVRLPSASSVGAGQTATFDLATNRPYFGVNIRYKETAAQATIEADITEVRVNINGKTQRRFTAAQLYTICALMGISFQPGILPIIFADPKRRTLVGEEGLAWGTADVTTFQIEVDIKSTAVSPALDGWAEVGSTNIPLGMIDKWKLFTFAPTGAGTYQIPTLPKKDAISRIHFFSSIVDSAKITVDQLEVFNLARAENTALLARQNMAQQTDTYNLCFDYTEQVTDALPMVKTDKTVVSELMVELEVSAAGNLPVLVQYLGYAD